MKKLLNSLTFAGLLSLSTQSSGVTHDVWIEVIDSKEQVTKVLTSSKEQTFESQDFIKETQFFGKMLELVSQNENISDETKAELLLMFTDENFKQQIFSILKENLNENNFDIVIRSLLLWLLYWALFHKFKKRKFWDKSLKSTASISFLTSGLLCVMENIIPGTFTVSEIAIMWLYGFDYYQKNKKIDYTADEIDFEEIDFSEQKASYLKPFENFNEPVVYYDHSWRPLLWNKKMEFETGYSFEEILEYHDLHWDVMDLLYKWDNREKVRRYLSSLEWSWVGYKNITFTLTTKYWEEKTFLWSLILDDDGCTLRFARHLENLEEIRRKLYETEQKLLRDKLTGAFNMDALEADFKKIINNKRRKQTYIKAMFDIDNFKSINDKYWHDIWNIVLKELVIFIKSKIRESDKVYRLHGDEFVILFESDNMQEILHKITAIREEFYIHSQQFQMLEKWVWTSWWMVDILPNNSKDNSLICVHEVLKKVDEYMYAVKYFKLIAKELIQRWVITDEYNEKNWVWCPRFDSNGVFLWVDVINSESIFFLSVDDLELITQRKKELDDSQMRNS